MHKAEKDTLLQSLRWMKVTCGDTIYYIFVLYLINIFFQLVFEMVTPTVVFRYLEDTSESSGECAINFHVKISHLINVDLQTFEKQSFIEKKKKIIIIETHEKILDLVNSA